MILRLVFFHIYNAYYGNGRGRKDIPHITASCVFTLAVGLLATMIILSIAKWSGYQPPMELMVTLWLTFAGILAFRFLYKSRYKEVYVEFRKTKWDTLRYKTISIIFIVFCYASLPLYAILFRER
jgi:hypothetical protein